jgi:energy-coupling factor transport system substrate-specific component
MSSRTSSGARGETVPRRSLTVVAGAVGLGAVLAVAVWVVGLPAEVTLGSTRLADLTGPVGLLVLLTGAWAAGWLATTRAPWRVVDIVVAAVLGVAGGLVFAVWNVAWTPLSNGLAFFPPASAVLVGVWLLPGVLGGLVVRRPGAAVFVETVAAVVSALVGNQWGISTVYYGLLQGLGAEVVLALMLYRRFGIGVALAAGGGAGLVSGLLDTVIANAALSPAYQVVYVCLTVLSGVVIAGAGAWALTRALATTGALAPLASGRTAERV